MAKATLRVGYTDYVMDLSDAVAVMEALGKAENYKTLINYDARPSTTSYHIWSQEVDSHHDRVSLQLLPDEVYRVAKIAGKPVEK